MVVGDSKGGIKMAEHIINGNEQHREGIERATQLAEGEVLRFIFSGKCDDRSYPVLSTVSGLTESGADFKIIAQFPYGTFRHNPDNDRPHMPHDCYSLIGMEGGGSVHPQEVNEVAVYGK